LAPLSVIVIVLFLTGGGGFASFSEGVHASPSCVSCTMGVRHVPTVQFGPVLGNPLAGRFWAIADQAPSQSHNSTLAGLMNATPIDMYRYDGAVDSTNQTTGLTYADNGTTTHAIMNDSLFAAWCMMQHCRAILGLPGEIDNPGAAAYTVEYVEQELGFHPSYWSIGNEPGSWTHFGIPWANWSSSDHSTCPALCYAQMVQRYVVAIRSVDPGARIIGIQDSACLNDTYMQEVSRIDGRNLTAVACHLYPANVYTNPTPAQLYSALQGPWSLPVKVAKAEWVIHYECPGCNLPLFVDEYNSAYFPIPLLNSYADAVFLAASMIQALELNVSQFAFFTLMANGETGQNYGLLGLKDVPQDTYYDYSAFADNLAMKTVINATITTKVGGVYSIETVCATHHSFFVVDANETNSVSFNLTGSGFPLTGSGTAWYWSPAYPVPRMVQFAPGYLPSHWFVPAQGILLIDAA
jgi:hypothetical protein